MIFSRVLIRVVTVAVVRRLTIVALVAALAWLGLGDASAHTPRPCEQTSAACNKEQAYNAASNISNAQIHCDAQWGSGATTAQAPVVTLSTASSWRAGITCRHNQTGSLISSGADSYIFTSGCPVGQEWNQYTYQCQQTCSGRPSSVQPFLPLSGSKQCFNGCTVTYTQNGDDETSTRSYMGSVACGNDQFKQECGAGFVWNSYMGVCQPIQPDCPEGQVEQGGQCKPENSCPDGMVAVSPSTPGAIAQGALHCKPAENECPPGNVRSPSGQCLPGEGQCAAGEARRPNGTCGRDANNDGVADDDDEDPENDSDKEQAFGGDTCSAPPSCNGPAIGCMQIKIQWRIDCNTRRNVNISGGSCNAVPLCTGESCNAMEYAQLMQQWESKCALKKIAEQDGTGESELDDYMSDRDAANKAQAEAIAAGGDGHEGVSESSIFGTFDNSSFNPNMFGGGSPGMCSFSTSLELMGNAIELPAGWWNLAAAIGWLVVAAAYVHIAVRLAS